MCVRILKHAPSKALHVIYDGGGPATLAGWLGGGDGNSGCGGGGGGGGGGGVSVRKVTVLTGSRMLKDLSLPYTPRWRTSSRDAGLAGADWSSWHQ